MILKRIRCTVKVQGSEFKIGIFRDFSVFSPQKIIGAPIWIRQRKLHLPRYRLVKVS